MNEARGGYLHRTYLGETVLLEPLHLRSFSDFLWASLLTAAICLTERFLTFALSHNWTPHASRPRSRWSTQLWRLFLYWLATCLRLLYMLIAMTFHIGLILVVATTLAIGQFITDLLESRAHGYESLDASPLPTGEPDIIPSARGTRSRTKPSQIHISPAQSNFARADILSTHISHSIDITQKDLENQRTWESGQGRELARTIMTKSSRRRSSEHPHFSIGGDDESDSD